MEATVDIRVDLDHATPEELIWVGGLGGVGTGFPWSGDVVPVTRCVDSAGVLLDKIGIVNWAEYGARRRPVRKDSWA
jgi:hypothetical protein